MKILANNPADIRQRKLAEYNQARQECSREQRTYTSSTHNEVKTIRMMVTECESAGGCYTF